MTLLNNIQFSPPTTPKWETATKIIIALHNKHPRNIWYPFLLFLFSIYCREKRYNFYTQSLGSVIPCQLTLDTVVRAVSKLDTFFAANDTRQSIHINLKYSKSKHKVSAPPKPLEAFRKLTQWYNSRRRGQNVINN